MKKRFIEIDQSKFGPNRQVLIVTEKILSISYLKTEQLIHIQIQVEHVAYEIAFGLDEEKIALENYEWLKSELNNIE